jgi:hypothetical protein
MLQDMLVLLALLALGLLPAALSMAVSIKTTPGSAKTTPMPIPSTPITPITPITPSPIAPLPMIPMPLPDLPNNNMDTLSGLERLGRALSFYSAAVPVFASYKGLETLISFRTQVMGEEVNETYVEEQFDLLHEWGSEVITEKIKELKGELFAKDLSFDHEPIYQTQEGFEQHGDHLTPLSPSHPLPLPPLSIRLLRENRPDHLHPCGHLPPPVHLQTGHNPGQTRPNPSTHYQRRGSEGAAARSEFGRVIPRIR